MKNSLKLFLAGAILVGVAASSAAVANNFDVVRDSNDTVVCAQSGDCVRTMWLNSYDECKEGKIIRHTEAVYFDFGRSTLTHDGKATLDALAATVKAKGSAVSGVRIAGFADRIGDTAKNEKLSKRRADRVRRYLVSKGIVNAQVVETRWFGDSVTTAQCPEGLSKDKLIACLQPDRRVEVEIDMH